MLFSYGLLGLECISALPFVRVFALNPHGFPSPLNPFGFPPPVYSLYKETIMRWVYVYKMLAETTESWKNNTACTRLFS